MEFNLQNAEKLPDDCGQARSYTCAFCRKGFSNAQALGGHMNIHRRDRAKLKQLSSDEENFLSLDISINNPTSTASITTDHLRPHHKPSNSEEKVLFQLDSGEDKNYTNNLHNKVININVSSAEALAKNIPLFQEKEIEIDLELRLGLEPHEAPTLSTREFF